MLFLFMLDVMWFARDLSAVFCKFSQGNKEFFLTKPAYKCPDAKNFLDLLPGQNIFGFADMIIAIGTEK